MDFYKSVAEQAAVRWQSREKVRIENNLKFLKDGVVGVETSERIQMRLDRLSAAATKEKTIKINADAGPTNQKASTSFLFENVGFERVIGKSDFLGMDFLEMALAVSRFVCRIQIRNSPGRTVGFGTGFMVSPRILITNNHVLGSVNEALHSEIEFDYQYDRYGRLLPVVTYGLEPQTFFMTDKSLDFTLVAVKERSFNDIELKRYGWNRLIADLGKVIHSDTLNIIQHPKGEAKQIVLRSNRLVDLLENFAHYETDTEPGSSGSPVYNDQWEVIALHHSGVPKMNDGNFIAKDGSIWQDGMDPNDLAWVANEGVRISSIVNYVKKQRIPSKWETLRDDLLNREPPHPFEAAAMANSQQQKTLVPIPSISSSPAPTNGTNGFTFTIPLQITIGLGLPEGMHPNLVTVPVNTLKQADTSVINSSSIGSIPTVVNDRSTWDSELTSTALRESLLVLENAKKEIYYDKKNDIGNRDVYYRDILIEAIDEKTLYRRLNQLLEETHTNRLTYSEARHKYLYPRVDLYPDKMLRSIYTGDAYDPEVFIRKDFEIFERLKEKAREQFSEMSSFNESDFADSLSFLEADAPYNAEHVVPQSWFSKRDPMKSDLHHLFSCQSVCNSFRGNIPFFEFTDYQEVIRQGCGKREENKFEPSQGHGAVARASLYFLLRYPGEINNTTKEYTKDRLATLIKWHEQEPVSIYELHRNAEIFNIQGNRNPLIDHPEWVRKIDFSLGLG